MMRVFRGDRRAGDEITVGRLLYQRFQEELRRALQDRVVFFQRLFIACVLVVIPEALAQPGSTRRPHSPERSIDRGRAAPAVGIVVTDPSARAIVRLRRLRARFGQVRQHFEQRRIALQQIRRSGVPVVHLRVDVDRVFRSPRRIDAVVPEPLQRCGLAARSGTGEQQIAPILTIESREGGIMVLCEGADTRIRGT